MKRFYYAPSNNAYVDLSDEVHAELMSRLEYNCLQVYANEDMSVFEIAENDPEFADNEQYFKKVLNMTDDQFNNEFMY